MYVKRDSFLVISQSVKLLGRKAIGEEVLDQMLLLMGRGSEF